MASILAAVTYKYCLNYMLYGACNELLVSPEQTTLAAIRTARSQSLACRERACVNGLGRERKCKPSRSLLDLLSHASALRFYAGFSDLARAFHVEQRRALAKISVSVALGWGASV